VQTHADIAAAFRSARIPAAALDFFQTPEWFGNLAATCGIPDKAVTILQDGAALLPLQIHGCRAGPVRGLTARGLSNFYSCRFAPPGFDASEDPVQTARAFGRQLRRNGLAHVRLDALDEADCHDLSQGLRQAGWIAEPFRQFGNWHLDTRGLTFADYWSQRPGRLRNTGARRRRALLDNGPGRVVRYREPGEAAAAVATYNHVAAQSWQKGEPYAGFLPGLIRYGLEAGELQVWALLAGNRPVAAQVWICRLRRATIFKLAFDRAWRRQSAGTVLTMAAIEAALQEGATDEIDFGWGDDPYKQDWLPVRRQRYGLSTYNPRTAYGLYAAARNLGPKAVRRILGEFRLKKQTAN
jgi:CelD/BcsL family acetyltransferase involved in cellulose biosynthesis